MKLKSKIQRITLIGLIANIFLSLIKLFIGLAGNSQAVVADALHSFSDTASDVVILFGVRYWTAPPDEDHPFGHHKIESFISILIGLLLIATACGIGYKGISSLLTPRPAHISWIVIAGPLLSIIIKEILFKITYKTGVQINSSSLKANAWHHRTDALSSIPVLIAVIACIFDARLWFLDPIGAIIVCGFIINVGLKILFQSINELLDTGISKKELRKIRETIGANPHVRGFHKLRTRKMASYVYIDLHLEVDGMLTVRDGHEISEQVKHHLLKTYPKIIDVMVHLEPERKSDPVE